MFKDSSALWHAVLFALSETTPQTFLITGCILNPSGGMKQENFSELVSFHSVLPWEQVQSLVSLFGWSVEWTTWNTSKTEPSGSFMMTESDTPREK